MKRIVYLIDGAIAICTPVINTYPELESITEDQAVDRAMLKLPATATDIRVLDESALPATRERRNSWAYNNDKTAVLAGAAPVPPSVTMRQTRLALLGAGLLDAVTAAITAAGPAAKIEWEYAGDVQRSAGLVPAMAAALGMSDAQLDALFIAAAAL